MACTASHECHACDGNRPCGGPAAQPAGSTTEATDSPSVLLQLPADLFTRRVLGPLTRHDKSEFRRSSRHCRQLVNAGVRVVHIPRCHLATLSSLGLPRRFPCLTHLHLAPDPPSAIAAAAAAAAAAAGVQGVDGSAAQEVPPTAVHHHSSSPGTSAAAAAVAAPPPAAPRGLSSRFPEAASSGAAAGCSAANGLDAASRELVAFMVTCAPQLPCWRELTLGCCAEVAPLGLDPVPALTAAAAATHSSSSSSGGGAGAMPQLTRLVLRGAQLGEGVLEGVAALRGLQELEVASTAALSTGPLSTLSALTSLSLTTTPPLRPALAPLAACTRLAALSLRAISPARGWGGALAALVPTTPTTLGSSSSSMSGVASAAGSGGEAVHQQEPGSTSSHQLSNSSWCRRVSLPSGLAQLTRLEVRFAALEAGDLAPLSRLVGLEVLDLTCSRPLTPAALPALASLPRLTTLLLQHTGLLVGPAEWAALGAGCPRLTTAALDATHTRGGWRAPGPGQVTGHASTPTTSEAAAAAAGGEGLGGGGSSCGAAPPYPPLTALDLLTSCSVGDMAALLGGLPGLTRLVVTHTGPGSDIAQLLGSGAAPGLVHLELAGCCRLADAAYAALGRLTGLQVLHMDMASAGSAHLGLVVNPLTALTALTVERLSCEGEDVRLAADWARHLGSCKRLALSRCSGVSEALLVEVVAACPRLQQLGVTSCTWSSGSSQQQQQQQQRVEAAAAAAGVVCSWA